MAFTCDSPMAHKVPEVRQRLTSRDAVFHALSVGFGQDPIDLRRFDFVARERFRLLHAVVRAIVKSSKPYIAAVEGWAAGAGFSLALCCDAIVAGTGAHFQGR